MRERNHYCEKEKKTGAQCAGHEEPVRVGEAVGLTLVQGRLVVRGGVLKSRHLRT